MRVAQQYLFAAVPKCEFTTPDWGRSWDTCLQALLLSAAVTEGCMSSFGSLHPLSAISYLKMSFTAGIRMAEQLGQACTAAQWMAVGRAVLATWGRSSGWCGPPSFITASSMPSPTWYVQSEGFNVAGGGK